MRYKDDEYKQIPLSQFRADSFNCNYNALKGKVVDKIAFNNRGSYDEQALTILFTDKTFISVGLGYVDSERNDDMELQNNWIIDPTCCNGGGDFGCHIWVDDKGKLHFDTWI